MSDTTLSRVQQVIADVFGLSKAEVLPTSSRDTIEKWDSLQHLNVVLALEAEFGVQFSPEEMAELLSVEIIAMILHEKAWVRSEDDKESS
jgi:acyl carrier protein